VAGEIRDAERGAGRNGKGPEFSIGERTDAGEKLRAVGRDRRERRLEVSDVDDRNFATGSGDLSDVESGARTLEEIDAVSVGQKVAFE